MLNQTVGYHFGAGDKDFPVAIVPRNLIPRRTELFPNACVLPTHIGIEVELERVAFPFEIDHNYWNVVADQSLRNQGFEAVSKPLHPGEVSTALTALDFWFQANPISEFSHRCSIHVHLDCTKLTVEQLYVLIGTYICVENLFFKELFPTRKGNAYCFPLNGLLLRHEDIQRKSLTKDVWKYAALNLYHLKDYGTLEFRHHPGTKDVRDIMKWIQILCDLYNYAQKTPFKLFKTLLMSLNTTSEYMDLVTSAIPSLPAKFEVQDIYHAVTTAKVLLHSIKD